MDMVWICYSSRGVHSSCHVRTNVCKKGYCLRHLANKACISETPRGVFVSLVCVFLKVVKNFEVNVDVEKEGPEVLRIKLTIDMLVSSDSRFHLLMSYGDSLQ